MAEKTQDRMEMAALGVTAGIHSIKSVGSWQLGVTMALEARWFGLDGDEMLTASGAQYPLPTREWQGLDSVG